MQNEPFVIETIYNTAVENVWKAITNSKEMQQWYFDVPGFRPEPGFEFHFVSEPTEERQYCHFCEVTESIIYKKLSFTWRYNHYDVYTLVTFELFEENEGSTRIKLTHAGLDSYPDTDPDFSKESFTEGWTWIICTALKEYLEKAYRTSPKIIIMNV